jgi:hypothetical protein
MSRKDEDRILHGLHYFRESLDEEFTVTSEQVLWLAAHSYADGSGWHKDGDLQGFDCSVIPIELRRKLLTSKFELPLRYLHYRRLIKFTPAGDEVANVSVTFAGADRAMRLHTRVGRMELWYQEHKDGFFSIVITAAVSFITALLAVAILEGLHRNSVEPARIIYEAEPRSQP